MPRDQRLAHDKAPVAPLEVVVQVGAADAAGAEPQQDLAGTRNGHVERVEAHLVVYATRPTTRKVRFVSEHHSTHLLRADLESTKPLAAAVEEALLERVSALLSRAGAVLLSGNRRRTILRTGLGIALGVALLLTLFNVARSVYLNALGPDVNHAAAASVYDQLVDFLRITLRSVFALGLVAAIGAWLAGPGETATKMRESTVGLFRGRRRASDAQPSAIAAFTSSWCRPA